jgi:serine/threonine-protein kinase
MSSNIPPPKSGARESCPLCGALFDPAVGHLCEDQQTGGGGGGGGSLADEVVEERTTAAGMAAPRASDPFADRYEIISELSRGGMGVVYKARRKILGDTVAIKVLLHPGNELDQRRFIQEAQLASKVNHPNTVGIYDFGVLPSGKTFLVMEFLQGPTLAALMRAQEKHQLDILRACRIAVQIAHGMQTVHDKGVVHRDLKPENIFILEHHKGDGKAEDLVKFVDFGIGKVQ